MTVAGEFAPFDKSAIEREPNPKSLAKLLKLPSFRAAYEFDGMQPSEFAHFGAFKATETEFANATRQTIDFVRRSIDAV
jgi:transaldolase